MSGVWVFRNGVVKLVENPPASGNNAAGSGGGGGGGGGGIRRKALLHMPTGEVVTSYASLERKLAALGWERYYSGSVSGGGMMLQFHKRSSVDLISLPKDFSQFGSVHMYDIVVKNRDAFRVIDV